jgi:hypothetical protein
MIFINSLSAVYAFQRSAYSTDIKMMGRKDDEEKTPILK